MSDPTPSAAFERQFDLLIPLKDTHAEGSVYPNTEDTALTGFLEAAIEEALSQSLTPPACPYCESRYTRLAMRALIGRGSVPAFICRDCKKWFNRMTGTPLARMARRDALPRFAKLLSYQAPYQLAVKETGLDERIVSAWVEKFRAWLLVLDPSGYWEAKVRLGIRPPRPELTCPYCDHRGEMHFQGFGSTNDPTRTHAERGRQFRCTSCDGIFIVRVPGAFMVTLDARAPTKVYNDRVPGATTSTKAMITR